MRAAKNAETCRHPSSVAARIDNAWPEEKANAHRVEVNPRIRGSLISQIKGWIDDLLVRYAYPIIYKFRFNNLTNVQAFDRARTSVLVCMHITIDMFFVITYPRRTLIHIALQRQQTIPLEEIQSKKECNLSS